MADDRTPRTISLTERPTDDEVHPKDDRDEDVADKRRRDAANRKKNPEREAREHPVTRLV